MKLLLENWRKYINEGCDTSDGFETLSLPAGAEGTWENQDIPCTYSDLQNVTNHVKLFALLMDKVAELLGAGAGQGIPGPVVTSGFRNAKRQTGPMLNIWKKNGGLEDLAAGKTGASNRGSAYIIKLYQDCYDKEACVQGDRDLIVKIVADWEANAVDDGVTSAAYARTVKAIDDNGGISKHQLGDSIDYGFKSNNPGAKENIKQAFDYIKANGFADFQEIPEFPAEPQHWHITVFNVTSKGVEFLKAPNSNLSKRSNGEQNETPT